MWLSGKSDKEPIANCTSSTCMEPQQSLCCAVKVCSILEEPWRGPCQPPWAHARRFEWVDGPLTRAIEAGGWVLLDNANMCPATVLDRLNPLLEPAGCLLLNEAGGGEGAPRGLRPHPGFRLILALDPRCVLVLAMLYHVLCLGRPWMQHCQCQFVCWSAIAGVVPVCGPLGWPPW